MILQTHNFNCKIVSIGIIFSTIFSLHSLAYTCVLHLRLQLLLVSFIPQSLLNRFQYNLCHCLLYACSISTAIFRLIQLLEFTPGNLLHSRVKRSITIFRLILLLKGTMRWYGSRAISMISLALKS